MKYQYSTFYKYVVYYQRHFGSKTTFKTYTNMKKLFLKSKYQISQCNQ